RDCHVRPAKAFSFEEKRTCYRSTKATGSHGDDDGSFVYLHVLQFPFRFKYLLVFFYASWIDPAVGY
ncbi:membrane insertase, YidC/Oxa1 family domain protein, partial [Chlamydia psittaci 84-8471/1]